MISHRDEATLIRSSPDRPSGSQRFCAKQNNKLDQTIRPHNSFPVVKARRNILAQIAAKRYEGERVKMASSGVVAIIQNAKPHAQIAEGNQAKPNPLHQYLLVQRTTRQESVTVALSAKRAHWYNDQLRMERILANILLGVHAFQNADIFLGLQHDISIFHIAKSQ